MDCFAGLAASAVGGKAVFEYNRENFLYDRERRLKMEFNLQKFKAEQAKLWREDVRDLISLTEYKMHVYLLTNILLLGLTVAFVFLGKLPANTPNWLMMGFVISVCGAFMFLLLSIWLAMQAAVAAQSYEARLLTQLVRLPIPTWQEIEACRTYACEFEHVEPKQIFRVPYLMKKHEKFVRGTYQQTPSERVQTDRRDDTAAASVLASTAPPPPSLYDDYSSEDGSVSGDAEANVPTGGGPLHADPWGLERRGDDIDELGCQLGSDVANLRHVKLARHAMVYWQTYDAFARVCMSIGVNQLLLTAQYYILGYIMVEVGSRSAATYGVLLLTGVSETITRLDMSLTVGQLRLLQVLLGIGPVCSNIAAYHWLTIGSNEWEDRDAEFLVVMSFISHGMYLALMSHFCRIRKQNNGAMLPVAFRSVLYQDVFGWMTKVVDRNSQDITRGRRQYSGEPGWLQTTPPAAGRTEAAPESSTRPALAGVAYRDGLPAPRRPEDAAPGLPQDMGYLPGAPANIYSDRPAGHTEQGEKFFGAPSWLPGKDSAREDPERVIDTGHEGNPGKLPWLIFTRAMNAMCIAWVFAAVYHALGSYGIWDMDRDVNWDQAPTIDYHRMPKQVFPASRYGWSLLGMGPSFIDVGQKRIASHMQRESISVSWPYPDMEPRSLSCDASGRNLVVSDGLFLFSAQLDLGEHSSHSSDARSRQPLLPWRRTEQKRQPTLQFSEIPCSVAAGQGLQDATVACEKDKGGTSTTCEVLVLYSNGRKVGSCALPLSARGNSGSASINRSPAYRANVSTAWLEQLRVSEVQRDAEGAPHARVEKAVSLAVDPDCCKGCSAHDRWQRCTLLGTTRGRVVKLRQQAQGASPEYDTLVPDEVLHEGYGLREMAKEPGTMRILGVGQYFGMLQHGGLNLHAIDATTGSAAGELSFSRPSMAASSFCAGGGYLYALGQGSSPGIWRVPFREESV